MMKEIELKFEIEQSSIASLLHFMQTQQVDEQHSLHLTNTYYDTDDNLLRHSGISMRIRSTNEETKSLAHEITVKSSGKSLAGLHARNEYNASLRDNKLNVSVLPTVLFPKHIDVEKLPHQLIPLFTTDFHRQTWLIFFKQSQIEIALDQGEVKASASSIPIQEVELELKSGSQSDLLRFAIELCQLNLHLFSQSKAARGYGLLQNDSLNKIDDITLSGESLSQDLTNILQFWQINEEYYLSSDNLIAYKKVLNQVQHYLAPLLMKIGLKGFNDLMPTHICWCQQIDSIVDAKIFAFSSINTKFKLWLMLLIQNEDS